MPSPVEQASRVLAEFEKTKSVDVLPRAVEAMAGVDLMPIRDTPTRLAARRDATSLWLRILAEIDRETDPRFNPADVPATRVIPPAADGRQLPAGASPEEIDDPRARAEYAATLQANTDKTATYTRQTHLRRIARRADMEIRRYFATYYTAAADDQAELEHLLAAQDLLPARAAEIRGLVHPVLP